MERPGEDHFFSLNFATPAPGLGEDLQLEILELSPRPRERALLGSGRSCTNH